MRSCVVFLGTWMCGHRLQAVQPHKLLVAPSFLASSRISDTSRFPITSCLRASRPRCLHSCSMVAKACPRQASHAHAPATHVGWRQSQMVWGKYMKAALRAQVPCPGARWQDFRGAQTNLKAIVLSAIGCRRSGAGQLISEGVSGPHSCHVIVSCSASFHRLARPLTTGFCCSMRLGIDLPCDLWLCQVG